MSWLFPGFLAGGALIGLPVLLHFLRRRPKLEVPFPSLRFLGETALRDTRRHRLRRWLTLLLRCLIIAGLAAGFARPFWVSAAARGRRAVVVALDNSMSMRAGGRWEDARAWALRQIDELSPGDQAAILMMHPSPTWLLPMTDDLTQIRAVLRTAQPGYEKTHYAPALKLAADTLAATPAGHKTLVWAADEQRLGWLGINLDHPLPDGVDLRLSPPVAAPGRQAAIVALRRVAATAPDAPGGLTATIRLFAPEQDQRKVEVRANDRLLASQTVTLHSGDNVVEMRFAIPTDAAGLRVSFEEADELPTDDKAWLALDGAAGTTILLETAAGTDFVSHALRSTQRLEDGALLPTPLPDGPWPAGMVAVVRGGAFRPPHRERLDRFVNGGGALWIWVDGTKEQTDWLLQQGVRPEHRAALSLDDEPTHLRDWDTEHPALAAFTGQSLLPLLNLEFYEGWNLTGDSLLPMAAWPDGKTAIAEWNRAGQHILLSGFPPLRTATNWPAQPTFVPFVHQALRWLGISGTARGDWHVGDAISLPPGEGVWRTLDAAAPQPELPARGTIRPAVPGLYEFTIPGGQRKTFAINPPPEESDLTPWPDINQVANLSAKSAPPEQAVNTAMPPLLVNTERAENQQRFWWWLLAFCGVCVLAELALANRTAM